MDGVLRGLPFLFVYLDDILVACGIRPLATKVDAIKSIPRPITKVDLQAPALLGVRELLPPVHA